MHGSSSGKNCPYVASYIAADRDRLDGISFPRCWNNVLPAACTFSITWLVNWLFDWLIHCWTDCGIHFAELILGFIHGLSYRIVGLGCLQIRNKSSHHILNSIFILEQASPFFMLCRVWCHLVKYLLGTYSFTKYLSCISWNLVIV